jgi:hypothetical protein
MNGWIKLHRQITEWEWYSDSNTFRLFIHLLLKANHKDNNYRGKLIKQGCLVTGREKLSLETGLSIRQVRTCLERLEMTNEIAIKSSSKGTEIQIVKYKDYQYATNETTSKEPTNDQQTTTNNNEKNDKEEKENIYRKFKHLSISLGEFKKLNEVYEKSIIDDILDRIENYKQNTKYSSLYLTANSWLRKQNVKDEPKRVNKNYSYEELMNMEK